MAVKAGGIGFWVQTPLPLASSVEPGSRVALWVYATWSQREGLRLYGFPSWEERELFRLMVEKVPRVGSALALKVLSGAPASEIRAAVARGQYQALASIKGVGEGTARSIVFHLRDALPAQDEDQLLLGAIEALVALGMERTKAREAARAARRELGPGATLEELVKNAISKR